MQELSQIPNQAHQLIDTRLAKDFRQGHIPGSVNLTIANIEKYWQGVMNNTPPIVWIIDSLDSLTNLENILQQMVWNPQQSFGYLLWSTLQDIEHEKSQTISVDKFFHQTDDSYQLLDVRHPDEITRPAPKKNLISIPLQSLRHHLQTLDSRNPIYTLCGSGNRATTASSVLKKAGLQAIVIDGGMKAVQAYLE